MWDDSLFDVHLDFGVILHEVPHDSGPLDCLPGALMPLHEGIVVPIFASALDQLSPTQTP